MGVEVKSPAILCDELITVIIKCFFAIDRLHEYSDLGELEKAGVEAVKVHRLNNKRNELIIALDKVLGFDNTVTEKTYAGK